MKLPPYIRIFICGATQSGKTFWADQAARGLKNLVVYDIKKQLGHLGVVVHDEIELERVVRKGCRRVVVQPSDISEEAFDRVCRFLYEHLRNFVFLVDEVHNFCSSARITPYFKKLITVCEGEPYRIGVWAISQRPPNVHWDVRGNAQVVVVFNLAKIDAGTIEQDTDIPAEEIQRLPKREFFFFDRSREWQDRSMRCRPLRS